MNENVLLGGHVVEGKKNRTCMDNTSPGVSHVTDYTVQ